MPVNAARTFEEYEHEFKETLQAWSLQQRLAFVTVLAERWLSAYEKFSEAERWGDSTVLRQIVSAVWGHCLGRPIMAADETRFLQQINHNAPDTEEFDQLSAWRALETCVILRLALECCKTTDNSSLITKAALTACETVLGQFPADIAAQQRAWKKVTVQEEFRKQSGAIKAIGAMATFEEHTVPRLRHDLGQTKTAERKIRVRTPRKSKSDDDESIEAWCVFVSKLLSRSAARRIAFVCCLAERLLPSYVSYTARAGKGRPELLREVLDTVWQSAKGRSLSSAVLQDLERKIEHAALDSQDAEEWSAWSAWRMVQLALACCGSVRNTELAEEAAVVGFERVAGRGARNDPNA